MTYNLIDQSGYLIKQFSSMKEAKQHIKKHNIKNYLIVKTWYLGSLKPAFYPCLVSIKAVLRLLFKVNHASPIQ